MANLLLVLVITACGSDEESTSTPDTPPIEEPKPTDPIPSPCDELDVCIPEYGEPYPEPTEPTPNPTPEPDPDLPNPCDEGEVCIDPVEPFPSPNDGTNYMFVTFDASLKKEYQSEMQKNIFVPDIDTEISSLKGIAGEQISTSQWTWILPDKGFICLNLDTGNSLDGSPNETYTNSCADINKSLFGTEPAYFNTTLTIDTGYTGGGPYTLRFYRTRYNDYKNLVVTSGERVITFPQEYIKWFYGNEEYTFEIYEGIAEFKSGFKVSKVELPTVSGNMPKIKILVSASYNDFYCNNEQKCIFGHKIVMVE